MEEDNCTVSCDPGCTLQESFNGTCENTGSGWEGESPVCIPLDCPDRIMVDLDVVYPSFLMCNLSYLSECTLFCTYGFTENNVTYLCNVTNDATVVDWMPIGGVDVMCERGLL